jgi:hypothetical protein
MTLLADKTDEAARVGQVGNLRRIGNPPAVLGYRDSRLPNQRLQWSGRLNLDQ